MIKKVVVLLLSLIFLVSIIFYGNVFEFKLNEIQSLVFKQSLFIYGILTIACFVVGEISKNYSQVDKVWSIAPMIYVWFFTYNSDFNSRMVIMSILVTVWGIRLTYNFARKSGYSIYFWKGEEDYRWKILKERVPVFNIKIIWSLFNLLFICTYQMGLIFLFTFYLTYSGCMARSKFQTLSELQLHQQDLFDFNYYVSFYFDRGKIIADNQQYKFQTLH